MLTTLRFFGILAGIFLTSLLGRAQENVRLPSLPPLYTAEGNDIVRYAVDNKNIYSISDFHAYKISAGKYTSINQLVNHLCPANFSDLQKTRSIYFWIAQNIQYMIDEQSQDQHAEHVFKYKKGVCEGFANLFHEMCEQAGIRSKVIVGYVKDSRFEQEKKLPFPNHAWNAVFINNKWQLLDVTWASFNKALKDKEELSENYFRYKLENNFLVDPAVFIYTHLPEDPLWQLTSAKVPFKLFLKDEKEIDQYIRQNSKTINYNDLISHHESLDSLDKEIELCERMANNTWNNLKSYRLGMAYFYKAQGIYRKMSKCQGKEKELLNDRAIKYYLSSLKELGKLNKNDFGYKYSSDLLANIRSRVDLLQFSN